MVKIKDICESYPFLNELDTEALSTFSERIILNSYEIGQNVFDNKVSCIGFSFILEGRLRVYKLPFID